MIPLASERTAVDQQQQQVVTGRHVLHHRSKQLKRTSLALCRNPYTLAGAFLTGGWLGWEERTVSRTAQGARDVAKKASGAWWRHLKFQLPVAALHFFLAHSGNPDGASSSPDDQSRDGAMINEQMS
tara:strand:- start:128043 stop:128423 length:381 start_codon:yes stop_codon:yes gene_type:complete